MAAASPGNALMLHRFRVCTIVLLLAPLAAAQTEVRKEGRELLANPNFANKAQGWMLRNAAVDTTVRHGGSRSVKLEGGDPDQHSLSCVGASVKPVPSDRVLRFSSFLRCDEKDQSLIVNAFGYDAKRTLTFQASLPLALADGAWKEISAEYVVPAGTNELNIWVINLATKAAYIADAHLVLGQPQRATATVVADQPAPARHSPKSLRGPGVIRATASAEVGAHG